MQRLFDNNFSHWKALTKRLLHKVKDLYIFHFDLKLSEQSLLDVKFLPNVYKALVPLWEKHSNLLVQSELNKNVFFLRLSLIRIKSEFICYKFLLNKGLSLKLISGHTEI